MTTKEQSAAHALRKFVGMRSGISFADYVTGPADIVGRANYRKDKRTIAKYGEDARKMLALVESAGITCEELQTAAHDSGGRLEIRETGYHHEVIFTPCQYWSTEYRAAVCRLLARALFLYADMMNGEYSDCRRELKSAIGRGTYGRWFK
jgi:hypothetical protein